MKTINPSAFQILNEKAKEANTSLFNYAKCESESDPNFFRWFFQDNDLEDFENPEPDRFEGWINAVTFDVYFNDENCSNNKGFRLSEEDCIDYIKSNNGTNESYFADYKGGTVEVVNNDTGESVYSEIIR